MKRILKSILAVALAAICTLPAAARDRKEILKVYNWSTYIAEGVIEDF